jgi:hypothetical protein
METAAGFFKINRWFAAVDMNRAALALQLPPSSHGGLFLRIFITPGVIGWNDGDPVKDGSCP